MAQRENFFCSSFPRLEGVEAELEDVQPLHSHAMSAFGKLDMLCYGTIALLIIGLVL